MIKEAVDIVYIKKDKPCMKILILALLWHSDLCYQTSSTVCTDFNSNQTQQLVSQICKHLIGKQVGEIS